MLLGNNTDLNGTGNDANNELYGNDGDNRLEGGAGDDTLAGGLGNDQLIGGEGNDILDGGNGADTLVGGAGNDICILTHANEIDKTAVDAGVDDEVRVLFNGYVLGAHQEHLTLLAAVTSGTGNDDNNILSGNASANTLNGGKGDNTLVGLGGDDTLNGGDADDLLLGGDANDTLDGGAGNDDLDGGPGVGRLDGGIGHDTLVLDLADVSDPTKGLHGGAGDDFVNVSGAGIHLDLTAIENTLVTGIEAVNFTGADNNTLTLALGDLIDLSTTTDTLLVLGEAGDEVISPAQGWTPDGTETFAGLPGQVYNRYISGAGTLLIDSDITQTQVT